MTEFTESCELAFDNRLARLVKLRELKAPWSIITREAVLIIKALTIHPTAKFWEEWGKMITPRFRNDNGWCAECDTAFNPDHLCKACRDVVDGVS